MTFTIQTRPRKRKVPKKRSKVPSRSKLVKELDRVFSLFIRQKWANTEGLVQCYTCPNILHWKKAQNSHYVSRSVRILRWEEDNCRPACYGCNVMHGGNLITFRENLIKELGENRVKEIEKSRHQLFKPTNNWLLSQIEKYE